jgi:MFS family permease
VDPSSGPARDGSARLPVVAIASTVAAFAMTMAGTTLPTPLYAIYSRRFGFQTLTVTVLFAVYAAGVVLSLSVFGRLSDVIGRRPVLLTATALSVIAALVFLPARDLGLLIVARVISGLAAGLMTGTGTAAVIDLFPAERRALAGTVAVAANTGGLAVGTLLAGILADLAPHPLTTPFVVQAVLATLAGAALFLTPWPTRSNTSRFQFARLRVPAEIRGDFTRAALAGGSGFAATGVLTAVSSVFLATTLHLTSHTLAGGVVAIVFVTMAVGQLLGHRGTPQAMIRGCLALAAAAVVLAVALTTDSLAALLVASVLLGTSAGITLSAGIASTVEEVAPAQRGEVSSSLFTALYIALALPAIGVGVVDEFTDLTIAGDVFCAVVVALATLVAWSERRRQRLPDGRSH